MDMENVKLYHFLHHTVGITNNRHPNLVLNNPDSLIATVETLVGVELAFYPGQRYEYGTQNYNVLGMVIESASGQSYETFMQEYLFKPLGLTQTFSNKDYAEQSGLLAQGYAINFIFTTARHDSPEIGGMVPTGGIISSARDMMRWMQIQLGLADDIPTIFKEIIPRSHIGDQSVTAESYRGIYSYYAAGWSVSVDGRRVEHKGNNPSFATYVLLIPEEQIGITVLSNINSLNPFSVADNIADILSGRLAQGYSMDYEQIVDIAFTLVTLLGSVATALFILLGIRRRKQNMKRPITRKRLALMICWSAITLCMGVLCCFFPWLIVRGNWQYAITFLSYSLLTGLITLVLLSASITWLVGFPRRTE